MDKTEYKKRKAGIEKEAGSKLEALSIEYAKANNKIKVGDIVAGWFFTILVKDIRTSIDYYTNLPECVYYGPKVTKKLKPYKSGFRGRIPQSSVKTINGEPVK